MPGTAAVTLLPVIVKELRVTSLVPAASYPQPVEHAVPTFAQPAPEAEQKLPPSDG